MFNTEQFQVLQRLELCLNQSGGLENLPEAMADFRASEIVPTYLAHVRSRLLVEGDWIPTDCEPNSMLLHRASWTFRLLFGSNLPATVVESNVEDRCVFSIDGRASLKQSSYAVHGIVSDQVFTADARVVLIGHPAACDYVAYFASETLATVQEVALTLGEVYVDVRRASTRLLRWAFSRDSGQAEYLYSSRIKWSQQVLLLDYLKASRHRSGLQAAEGLLNHPFYLVRWKAVQMIAALQPERFAELMDAACGDPHPLIRKAARALQPATVSGAK